MSQNFQQSARPVVDGRSSRLCTQGVSDGDKPIGLMKPVFLNVVPNACQVEVNGRNGCCGQPWKTEMEALFHRAEGRACNDEPIAPNALFENRSPV